MTNQIKTLLLLGTLTALLVGLGGLLGPNALGLSVVLALAVNAGAYFFSDRLVLAMSRARELSPDEAPHVHRLVEELSASAGIPKPRLYLVPEAQPNAFATGRDPEHAAVAVTVGLLDVLDARELRGVLAHELAHVKNRDILVSSIAATFAGAITWVAHAVGFLGLGGAQDDDGPSPAQALVLALVAPLAATLIQLGISRSREYGADRTGALVSGDPEALARALEKLDAAAQVVPAPMQPATASLFIVNPFTAAEGIVRLFSTHPSTQERVRRLRAMPAEPHPGAGRVAWAG